MTISPSIMTTYGRIDIAFTHGEGSYLFSEDGKKYLDFVRESKPPSMIDQWSGILRLPGLRGQNPDLDEG